MTRRILMPLACALLLAAGAWAEMGTATAFHVPFAFEAAGKAMPAGEYSLVKRTDRIAVLNNPAARAGVAAVWRYMGPDQPADRSRLVFTKVGGAYYLRAGQIPGFVAEWKMSKQAVLMQATARSEEVILVSMR